MAHVLHKPRFDKTEEHPLKERQPKERYPEMVQYFRERFNPRKESLYDFMSRRKSHHAAFLRKRGWSDKSIDLAWDEILASLSRKRARYKVAVRELKRYVAKEKM